jgi:serine/threonine protein kinase
MALTPATLTRLDLKCGKGAISKGEKCTKGPATAVEEERKGPTTKQKVVAGIYVAALASSLVSIRNTRRAYDTKFGGTDRVTPLDGVFGDSQAFNKFQTGSKGPAAGMFGRVTFGSVNGKSAVLKVIDPDKAALTAQVKGAQALGLYTESAANNIIKGANGVTKQELDHARLAGELGFGPKVIAANPKAMLMETAQGRTLGTQDRTIRFAPKVAQDPARQVGLIKRNITKGTEISDVQKRRLVSSMARMHTAGIAHNDLHPNNVFVSNQGAQFIDFGASTRGGKAVAHEFVQLMNKPRYGLTQLGGMGYNLKTIDPKGYAKTEAAIKKAIGKRVGTLTAADIAKAKGPDLDAKLQAIIDGYYTSFARA